jgi:hypothetical protein
VSTASFGRLGHLLRWLGLTLVVLLALQLLVLVALLEELEELWQSIMLKCCGPLHTHCAKQLL